MKFAEYAEKMEKIKYLAEHKQSGTPHQLAARLNVSERTIERMIQQLRESGYHIRFNRYRGSYEVDQ